MGTVLIVIFWVKKMTARTVPAVIRILGMHKTTYTNYEQGKREIPFALVIRLANFYNVSINYIAGIDKRSTPLHPNRPCPWQGDR
jgi:transcriptional regulator with XRE-family HTH domain